MLTTEEKAELEMLRAFACRHGWRAADGVYVAGLDKVYYCTCQQTPTTPADIRSPFEPWLQAGWAENIPPSEQHSFYSTEAAAEDAARRAWEFDIVTQRIPLADMVNGLLTAQAGLGKDAQ